MDLALFVNGGLVASIIVIIQLIKGMLKNSGIILPDDWWKVIAALAGLPFGFVMSAIDGFNFWDAIVKAVCYAGAAILFYQTGKLTVLKVKDKVDVAKNQGGK